MRLLLLNFNKLSLRVLPNLCFKIDFGFVKFLLEELFPSKLNFIFLITLPVFFLFLEFNIPNLNKKSVSCLLISDSSLFSEACFNP